MASSLQGLRPGDSRSWNAGAPLPPVASSGRLRRFLARNTPGYVFLLPWLIGFLVLTLEPILASLYLSFTDYDMLSPPFWVGLDNYTYMFTDDPRFRSALRVTVTYVVLGVPAKLIFALALAMLLNQGIRGLSVYRALFYLPSLLGASVAIAILWRKVFDTQGIVNKFLSLFGFEGPSWLFNPDYSIYTLVALAAWQFGAPMLIFLAGLRQIPQELYEAASIDGASAFRKFRKITVPLLAPVIFFNLVLEVIHAFKVFSSAFIISDGRGAPADSLLFFTLYLYDEAFAFFRMGYASALAWVLLLIIAACTAISFYTSKYWVYYEDAKD